MALSIKIHVLWNKERYEITVPSLGTIHDLRKTIFEKTRVVQSQQILLFDTKEMPNDHTPLQQLQLRSDSVVVLTSSALNQSKPNFPEAAEPGPSKKTVTTSKPRSSKLVVLDIDGTLLDLKGLSKSLYRAQRPNLQKFLKSVYDEYEIIIWSDTKMASIEKKLRSCNISHNPNYKILCCLDHDSMIPIPWADAPIQYVKSLEVVWEKYPEYNKKNTIICDNKLDNLLLNTENGVLVQTYSFNNYGSDQELQLLAHYLKFISSLSDMSTIDHAKWRILAKATTNLRSDAAVILATSASNRSKPTVPDAAASASWKLTEPEPGPSKQTATTRKPESGKLLLVLDIDKTILDAQGLCESLPRSQRPYLHKFLKSVYDNYEIIFWSGTDMVSIQRKLGYSNISRDPNLKILCCLDKDVMVPNFFRKSTKRYAKSLEVVWKFFPEYNKKNTIICDNRPSNLYLNKENGVLIERYSFKNHATDRELRLLAQYLKNISSSPDVSTIDHSKWRELAD